MGNNSFDYVYDEFGNRLSNYISPLRPTPLEYFLKRGRYRYIYFWNDIIQMVKNVAYSTKIDKQGRIVIPAKLRKKMNLEEESEIELEIYSNRLILPKKVEITPK